MQNVVYKIGLVMSRQGLSRGQVTELQERLKFAARALGKDYQIELCVVSIKMELPLDTWPDDLKKLGHSTRINVVALPCESVEDITDRLALLDEVWCCPPPRHTKKSIGRPSQIYRMALTKGPVAKKFRWIPPWIGDFLDVGMKKEGKTK